MIVDDFNSADPRTWLARGRTPEQAEALAASWRDFPDLPHDAPLADRQARSRARVIATRPIFEAMRVQAEAERQARNFAFLENQAREGKVNDRDLAILRGRDDHGYDWDVANRYADGWYAAHVGWPHSYPDGISSEVPLQVRRAAYDQGFTDGGGDRTDLFDAARRTNLAQLRQSNMPPPALPVATARPLPSSWPKPGDEARPARWSRRLIILSDEDVSLEAPERAKWDFLRIIRERQGADDMAIVILSNEGFAPIERFLPQAMRHGRRQVSHADAAAQLRAAIMGRNIEDVLVALQGDDLHLLDAVAGALPLCRTMERTRNTKLQQRAHLRAWLDRGYDSDENMAAGHIRWGKLIHGLTGKLGEFTARHIGAAPGRGHLIRVYVGDDRPATGYAGADGVQLPHDVVVSSKAKLRSEMAATLRRFGAATPLMALSGRDAG